MFGISNASTTIPGIRFYGILVKYPDDDSGSNGSIISSQSNDNHKSLKSSDTPDSKHPSPMIEGIDLITSENVKHIFKCDKGKYSSKANLECYRQLMITRGMDPTHGILSVNQKSNEGEYTPNGGSSRSSSSSSSSSGSSSTYSLSSSFSSAIGSDVSKPIPECAANKRDRAPTELRLADSSHHCWGCYKKIHSALQCGSSMSDLIFKNPSVVGMSLNNGNIIQEADDNETCAICFTCLGPLPIFFSIKT